MVTSPWSMSAIIHIGHGHARGRQPVLQRHAGLDRLAELAADAHRLPEQEVEPGRLGVLGDFRPAVDGDRDQFLAAGRIVEVPIGEDRELRADRGAAEIGGDVGRRS